MGWGLPIQQNRAQASIIRESRMKKSRTRRKIMSLGKLSIKSTQRVIAVVAGVLSVISMGGCAGVFSSAYTEEEMRETAYHIATTQLATTPEVVVRITATLEPGAPTPTVDPTYCPPDEIAIWKETALVDVILLDADIQIIFLGSYETDELEEIMTRAHSQIISIEQSSFPRCAEKAVRRLIGVYDQFIDTMEAIQSRNPATLPHERAELIEAMPKLIRALKELFVGEDFRDFEDVLEKYAS